MEKSGEKTDDDFVVVICITKLMHDFDDNAYEIALTGRKCTQDVEASGDEPRRKGFLGYHMSYQHIVQQRKDSTGTGT
jgi:hypothetical protein